MRLSTLCGLHRDTEQYICTVAIFIRELLVNIASAGSSAPDAHTSVSQHFSSVR
jgi:hypothetical protein